MFTLLKPGRCLALLLLLLAGAGRARAQDAPAAWPRDSTGQVSFRGQLPWPDSVRGEGARQALVRRWFLNHLTDMEAPRQAYLATQGGTAFGQVPRTASLRFDTIDHEASEELYQLVYQLDFVATPTGLAYQLTDFELLYAATDTGSDQPLEDVLAATPTEPAQRALAAFRLRLGQALGGW